MENCKVKILKPQTRKTRNDITPKKARRILEKGNEKFVDDKFIVKQDLTKQIDVTSKNGQFPFAAVLSCVDSRIPTETIFNCGVGDIFNARVAGNFVNRDILGSLEFASTHDEGDGVRLILVLGHTKCGAINAAIGAFEETTKCECNHENEESNIGYMLNSLCPPVLSTCKEPGSTYHDRVTKKNVVMTMDKIRCESKIIRDYEDSGKLKICGGIYDVATGVVNFL